MYRVRSGTASSLDALSFRNGPDVTEMDRHGLNNFCRKAAVPKQNSSRGGNRNVVGGIPLIGKFNFVLSFTKL